MTLLNHLKNFLMTTQKKKKINAIYDSISKIENKQYDRIISIMTFEHLENLPEVVDVS